MSHEIRRLDRAGYALRPAWHGLGVVFDHEMTGAEVADTVGAYNVVQGRGYVPIDRRTGLPFKPDEPFAPDSVEWVKTEAHFNFRDDVGAIDDPAALLSPTGVGPGYEVVQNRRLVEIADSVIGQARARYESAGTLRNGQMLWILAKWPTEADVQGDRIARYLLVYSTHDGLKGVTIQPTSVRVVCWNTLSAALADSSQTITLRHTCGVEDRIAAAIATVRNIGQTFDADTDLFNSLARRAIDRRFVAGFLNALYPNPKGTKRTGKAEAKRERIDTLLMGRQEGAFGPGMRIDGQPTAYALYNAVCQYWQHDGTSRMRAGCDRAEERFRSNTFGSQADQRRLALETLTRSDELVTAAHAAIASN